MERAKYVADKLSNIDPNIHKAMILAMPHVKTLSQEEINTLFGLAQRLGLYNNTTLDTVNDLVKQWNAKKIVLTEEEQKTMQTIFSRSVNISADYEQKKFNHTEGVETVFEINPHDEWIFAL